MTAMLAPRSFDPSWANAGNASMAVASADFNASEDFSVPAHLADTLACRTNDPDIWFADEPAVLEQAKSLCQGCPLQMACLTSALARREPWGVWGGQILERGEVIGRKRPRGRPRKELAA
jgi:WhiB family redox-sensing transcriptional regulator